MNFQPPPLEVTHDNSSESENSAPEDAHACSKKEPPRKDTGPHLQMQSYDQTGRQAMFSTDTLPSARGGRRAGGDGATGRRRRSSRKERRRAGREKVGAECPMLQFPQYHNPLNAARALVPRA